jgi:benzoylformate decarboxylase
VKAVEESDISYHLTLHEDVAVGAAAGYASISRYSDFHNDTPLGVANLHTSGGLAHGLANVYGARSSRAPVLVIVGTQSTSFRHEEPILSDDCQAMLDQYCRWTGEITSPESAMPMFKKAVRNALTPPKGPTGLMLPLNVAEASSPPQTIRIGDIPEPGPSPSESIDTLSELCSSSEELCFVVGDEIARDGRETVQRVIELAETTGAIIYGEILMAECNFPTDHEQWVSVIPPKEKLAKQLLDLETVIFIGCNHQTGLFESISPLVPEATTCVQVNTCLRDPGRSQHVDVALTGDINSILNQILHRLEEDGSPDNDLRNDRLVILNSVKELVDDKLDDLRNAPEVSDRCTQKNLIEVMNRTDKDYVIVDEGVTGRYELLTQGILKPERYLSNKGGALGYGLPASIGTAFAIKYSTKDLPVVSYVGDGSFWYYPQSLYTAASYSLNLIVVVLKNERYQILEDNAEDLLGEIQDFDSTRIEGLEAHKMAESQGITSYSVKEKQRFETIFTDELNSETPSLIEVELTSENIS